LFYRTLHLLIILLLYVLFKHPRYTYRGFGSTFSDRGMTLIRMPKLGHQIFPRGCTIPSTSRASFAEKSLPTTCGTLATTCSFNYHEPLRPPFYASESHSTSKPSPSSRPAAASSHLNAPLPDNFRVTPSSKSRQTAPIPQICRSESGLSLSHQRSLRSPNIGDEGNKIVRARIGWGK
jgi:hypothetical protein